MACMTAAASVAGIGAASATGNSEQCSNLQVTYSVDGGQSWSQDTRLTGDTAPTKFIVKLVGDAPQGCEFKVSLAYYSAEGATWETSGTQALLGWDTDTLSKSTPEVTLDVSGAQPSCFGQVDLYGNGTKFDGTSGNALPHYPDTSTPTDLIAPWNGGAACTTTPTPSPSDSTPTPSPSASDTTSPSPSPSDTTSPSPSPSDSTSASPSPSDSGTPTATASATAPAGGSSKPPTGSPVVQPVSSTPTGNLAETGGNGSQTIAFAGGGAALLVAGGAAVYFTRRRNRPTS